MIRVRNIATHIIIISTITLLPLYSQAPFSRGVNLTGWFQVDSPGQIQFNLFTKQDIANIKSLGCDVIRLPVNLHSMTSGSPSYILDPLYVSFLDSVITWCEDLNMYLIIDNHSFDPNVGTSPDIGNILTKVWSQTAAHLKDRSDYILYEILNEPHGISTSSWGSIQNQVINTIRASDSKHTIIVGGSGYNSYNELSGLPSYTDDNLLYTFHFYDPFMFTHQGATWTDPSMAPLSGVPFPYDAASMPACPPALKGTWVESSLNNYPFVGTVDYVKELLNIAVNFKNSRHVNIFCGEFGVFIPNSDPTDRCYWYEEVRKYLEENDIPWTSWDYKGTFGLFNGNSDELFDHDLNVSLLQALGLNVPPQTPFEIKPDSAGFMIYTDYAGRNIITSGSGAIDFYCPDMPNNGTYCLYWHNFIQYSNIAFDFKPDRDLSRLVNEGYAIDFMVRGNLPGIKFDIRFLDTKTGDPSDHPWRISTTIDNSYAAWDRRWHHVHIPLSEFTESGSWDNNTWYNPQGQFDWSAIDRFEISMEDANTSGEHIWFDNIHITDLDTAQVREFNEVGISKGYDTTDVSLNVMPNPFSNMVRIEYSLISAGQVDLSVYSISGQKLCTLVKKVQEEGDYVIYWEGKGESGADLSKGIYVCVLRVGKLKDYVKIVKI
jgi:endoglucanase